MLYGVYLSAAGMALNQHRSDVVANNLANVNTPGFKRDLAVFKQRALEGKHNLQEKAFIPFNLRMATGGPFVQKVYTDFSDSAIEHTGRNLDIAISGDGFLMVKDGNEIRLSRDGRLAIVDGKLVRECDGKEILDVDGREIECGDVSAGEVKIDSRGGVWAKGSKVGMIGIARVESKIKLRKLGSGLFGLNGQKYKAEEGSIISGAIESSGVEPSKELVEMIKTSRNFELNAKMLSMQDETLGRLINELSRLS